MLWIALDKRFHPDDLGFLPAFLSEADERPAAKQLDENYAHGGGVRPLPEWKMDPETFTITYPGDPPLKPLAFSLLRRERILFYPYSQVAIIQPGGSFIVFRCD